MKISRACKLALATAALAAPAAAQIYDDAALKKWSNVKKVRYEAVGVIADKHVQIPPTDADLYADVVDKVTLVFIWDQDAKTIVGEARIVNGAAEVSNLMGMEKGCPTGSIDGRYEHFDALSLKADGSGSIEISGERIHPDTSVAESCGAGRRVYKGAVKPRTEHIAPPAPFLLAYRTMMKDGPVRFSADGQSMITTAQNNNWTWTFTPTPATGKPSDLDDLEVER